MNKLLLFAIVAAVFYYFFIYNSCCFQKVCSYKCVQKMYKKTLKRIDKLLEKANKKQSTPAIEEIKTLLTDAKTRIIQLQLELSEAGWNIAMAASPLSCKAIREDIDKGLEDAERALRA